MARSLGVVLVRGLLLFLALSVLGALVPAPRMLDPPPWGTPSAVAATLYCSTDADANGESDALTDGLLIIRHLFGFSGPTLTAGALAPNATRTDPAAIAAHIEANRNAFDIDANGSTDALSDGLLLIRRLFGFSGSALTEGALAPGAARTDPAQIGAYIDALGSCSSGSNQAPQVHAGTAQTLLLPATTAVLEGTASDDGLPNPPGQLSLTWSQDSGPGSVSFSDASTEDPTATFPGEGTYVLRLTAYDGELSASATVTITVTEIPPDPSTVAPPIDPTVATTTYAATQFLYSGADPIQTGVAPGTIEPRRVAVVRGKVSDRGEQPLAGVVISVLDHPELGQTLTREDGRFDLAVNGGGVLTLVYEKAGYLPAQRQVQTPWQDYAFAPDVALVTLDPAVTAIDLTAPADIQVARGSESSDADGARRATLLFPAGTAAEMRLPDGTTQPLTMLHVRATEYSIGPNGPQAMPAELPPTSGYTYAVEIAADEALAAGATSVVLSQAIPFYVENFLGFPIGSAVPVGYYDRAKAQWIAAPNARVVQVTGIAGGLADLDVDGDGNPETETDLAALGITGAERERLAQLYSPGQELWRAQLDHFTPWDCNSPWGPDPSDKGPDDSDPKPEPPVPEDDPCETTGSTIACETQTIGEAVAVTGTPFSLHYQSARTPGYRAGRSFTVALTDSDVPPRVKRIELAVSVAGSRFEQSFAPEPNLQTAYTWDGLDAYGRPVQGGQRATVSVSYIYDGIYYATPEEFENSFALASGQPTAFTREGLEIGLAQISFVVLGAGSPGGEQVAGWSLSVHHSWDATRGVLLRGDGTESRTDAFGAVITTVAGNGESGFSGDGGPATAAQLRSPSGVAAAADGSLYIADYSDLRIRRVSPDGIITTVAGNGESGFSGDGGPATAAQLAYPSGVAVAADGSLYIADTANDRIRRTSRGTDIYTLLVPATDGTEVYVFDTAGRHSRTLDALTGGDIYELAYDSEGRHLISVTDGSGNLTAIERNGAGEPTAIVGPYGQRTELTLDANGYLASIANPAGETYRMEYTADGLLTRFEDPRTNASNLTYDALGRLTQDANAAGGSQNLTREVFENPPGTEVTVTTAEGVATGYKVEDLPTGEQRRTVTQPDGTAAVAVTGTDGTTTMTRPDGIVSTIVRGPDPRFGMSAPVITYTITTPSGRIFSSDQTRMATLADPNDPLSLVTLTDAVTINGRTSTSVYDAATRTTTNTSAAGRTSTTEIDAFGRPTLTQTAGLAPVAYSYDDHGRLESRTQGTHPDTRTFTLAYDAEGYLSSITDPLGHTMGFDYSLAGRIIGRTFADDRETLFDYDAKGNLISLVPPGSPEYGFGYTPVDLLAEYVPPDVGAGTNSTQFSYNLDKQLTRELRPDGEPFDLGYDAAGRIATLTVPEGTFTYPYSDTTGKLSRITAPDGGELDFTYDGALLTGTTWLGEIAGNVGFAYDNNFRLTSVTVNGTDPIDYAYDPDGLLLQAGDLTLDRDAPNGLLIGSALGTVADTWDYNGFGEPVSYTATQGGAPLIEIAYIRDKLGRITEKAETIDGITTTYVYGYDLAGDLVEVQKDGVVQSTWGYDANGNRTHVDGAEVAHYDDQDRLLDYAGITYAYTANGELIAKTQGADVTRYDYDVLGNLRQVVLPDSTVIDYVIDGRNRRIGKKINGTLVQSFLYQDRLRPVAELDGAGNVVSLFVYATRANVPEYMLKGGVTYRIVTDHLGSPRLVVDAATGAIAQRMDYDVWGNATVDTNPGFQPFGFAGGLYDRDTGLVRFLARDYDPVTGVWTGKDPIRFHGFSSTDVSLYAYALGDPVNKRDPSGLVTYKCVEDCVKGTAAGLPSFVAASIGAPVCGVLAAVWDWAAAQIAAAAGGAVAVPAAALLIACVEACYELESVPPTPPPPPFLCPGTGAPPHYGDKCECAPGTGGCNVP
jgi:RHS repeat-associated protein